MTKCLSKKFMLALVLIFCMMLSACSGAVSSNQSQSDSQGSSGPDSQVSASEQETTGITDPNVNPPGVFPICKEPIVLTMGVVQSMFVEDYETNALALYMEELGNMDIQFVIFPSNSSEANQKLEVMINSGTELPDVLMGFSFDSMALLNYGSQGVFLALNDYIDTIGVEVHDAFERVSIDNLRELMTQADGNIYNLPKYTEQVGNMHSQRQWINQVWLDNLGLDMPTTTDDFIEVLKAFRDLDPNQNGKKDEVPFTGSQGWQSSSLDAIMNAFIYNDAASPNNKPRWILENGILDTPYTKEEWREGLRYLKMLVSEGLLSPMCITQDVTQLQELLAAGDESQVGVYTAGANLFGATDERKLDYAPLPPLTGPEGVCWTAFYPSAPGGGFIITKFADHPEAAFRLGDYCMSEDMAFRSRFGVPEVDWREPGPDDKGLYEDLGFEPVVVPILPFNSVQNSYFGINAVLRLGIQDGQAVTVDDPLYTELFIAEAVPYYLGKTPKEYVDLIKYNQEEYDQIKDIYSTLVTYVNESMARFVTGDMDLDTQWDAYLEELDNIGLQRFVEISQTAYDRDH